MISQLRRLDAASFLSQIDRLVLAEVQVGTVSFSELLQSLPSIYPTEVLAALNRLAEGGRLSEELCNYLHRDAERRPGRPPDGRCLLPLPHPLDYEWGFAPDSSPVPFSTLRLTSRRLGEMYFSSAPQAWPLKRWRSRSTGG